MLLDKSPARPVPDAGDPPGGSCATTNDERRTTGGPGLPASLLPSLPAILVITGPTASGKTRFAIEVAEAVDGEIVSADSMQVYRHLDIGTAKPTARERGRVPHHLVDVADPDEAFHAARFVSEADRAIADIAGRGRVPVVCGGTALYLKALLHGLAPAPGRDPEVRAELEARWDRGEREALRRELARVDPGAARRLHPNDRTRIVRALEVWRVTGRPISELHRAHRFGPVRYRALMVGLLTDRPDLYRRIDERVVSMVEAGWVEEVRQVLSMGYGPHLPPLRAIGYRQICAHVLERRPLDQAVAEIQQETRRFAKRQMTWFRRMPIRWVPADATAEVVTLWQEFCEEP